MTISFVMDFDQHSFLTGHGVSAKTKLFSSQMQRRGQHISTCVFQMSHVQNIRNCSGTQVCCVSVQNWDGSAELRLQLVKWFSIPLLKFGIEIKEGDSNSNFFFALHCKGVIYCNANYSSLSTYFPLQTAPTTATNLKPNYMSMLLTTRSFLPNIQTISKNTYWGFLHLQTCISQKKYKSPLSISSLYDQA